MIVISFATEAMCGALVFAMSSGARCEGAEVGQQGPATQAEFRMTLVAVQAPASVHQAVQAVHQAVHQVAGAMAIRVVVGDRVVVGFVLQFAHQF